MSDNATAAREPTGSVRNGVRLPSLLLAVGGSCLIGAGALLWSRYGAAVLIDNPILAVLAWCF
jgi:hypothetical protein